MCICVDCYKWIIALCLPQLSSEPAQSILQMGCSKYDRCFSFVEITINQCILYFCTHPYYIILFVLQKKEKEGRPLEYMAAKYGQVVTPGSDQPTRYELKFRTSKKLKSMIVLSMVADDLKTVTNL